VVGVVIALLLVSSSAGTGLAPLDASVRDAKNRTVDGLSSVAGVGLVEGSLSGPHPNLVNETAIEHRVHERTNAERHRLDRQPVVWNPRLQDIARTHSVDMAEAGRTSHVNAAGETVGDRYERFGYDCPLEGSDDRTEAETVARVEITSMPSDRAIGNRIFEQWTRDAGARSRILESDWQSAGVGVHVTREGGTTVVYATQNFC
jgi:uncharacterized protein YkwD